MRGRLLAFLLLIPPPLYAQEPPPDWPSVERARGEDSSDGAAPARAVETRPSFADPEGSPRAALKALYETRDPDELMRAFEESRRIMLADEPLFREALADLHGSNDRLDLRRLESAAGLDAKDRMRWAIRIMARSILRMRDLGGNCDALETMLERTRELPDDWRARVVFRQTAYQALSASCPGTLEGLLDGGRVPKEDERLALLAFAREGGDASQERLERALKGPDPRAAVPLTYYVDDPRSRLAFLNAEIDRLWKLGYDKRRWEARDVLNAMASFPEGAERLDELKAAGRVSFVTVEGVRFGTLGDSGVPAERLSERAESLRQAARYVEESNRRFAGKEPVVYVDVTPDRVGGRPQNPAGWSANALYMTEGRLDASPRAVAFELLHEACEQKFERGRFTSELGSVYVDAFENGGRPLETFRLGTRIGEESSSGLGHPWDSEREWLAETASASIIGEPLNEGAAPALRAVERLTRKTK